MNHSIEGLKKFHAIRPAGFSPVQMGWRQDNAGRIEFFTEKVPVNDGAPLSREELREWLDADTEQEEDAILARIDSLKIEAKEKVLARVIDAMAGPGAGVAIPVLFEHGAVDIVVSRKEWESQDGLDEKRALVYGRIKSAADRIEAGK